MTREDATERLKTDIYKYADFTENPNEDEFWMAFDMAIKALEQEPMRDATPEELKSVNDYIKSISKPTRVDFGELEQEPKTGQWIETDMYDESVYKCSCCGESYCMEYGSPEEYGYIYCPCCGAKMKEGD